MNNYKLIKKIIELANKLNIDIYLPSSAFVNQVFKTKYLKNLNKIEIGLIIKEESSIDNYLNALELNNFIYLVNRNQIKIYIENCLESIEYLYIEKKVFLTKFSQKNICLSKEGVLLVGFESNIKDKVEGLHVGIHVIIDLCARLIFGKILIFN
jgi:hypothetical protein